MIKKLLLIIFLLSTPLFAQNTVTVTDNNFVGPLGQTGNWTATVIAPTSFISADGYTVPGGWQNQFSISGSTFSTQIIPNALSIPAPSYYTVTYNMVGPGGQGSFTEDWCVPATQQLHQVK